MRCWDGLWGTGMGWQSSGMQPPPRSSPLPWAGCRAPSWAPEMSEKGMGLGAVGWDRMAGWWDGMVGPGMGLGVVGWDMGGGMQPPWTHQCPGLPAGLRTGKLGTGPLDRGRL